MLSQNSWLFPSHEVRCWVDNLLTCQLSGAQARVRNGSVVPSLDLADIKSAVAAYTFDHQRPLAQTLMWVIEHMECGLVHVNHPRYFGLFNPSPTFPAECADRIVASFNPQLATSTTSPVAVEIEAHVIRSVAARAGLPADASGHFTSGGSEANYTALILALSRQCPAFATDGARAFAGAPVFYVSTDSHRAWLKIAHQAGIGRSAMRLVATDGSGRLDITALEAAIDADRASGAVPVMIVATAGTTNAGMIDPIADCARIARKANVWYHVDAAWGGGLIASTNFHTLLAGMEQADSITIDAHKWFATTMGCGMLLTRWPAMLASAFQSATSYMPSNIPSVDPYVSSLQWSRRFLGLRLFLALAAVGWEGYGEHIEHTLMLSDALKELLRDANWTVVNDSPVGVVCCVPPHAHSVKSVADHVLASGQAWISTTEFEGRDVIRMCVTNGMTSMADITMLISALRQADEIIFQQEQ